MIADLMFAGTWHDLVVLARWTHPFIVSLCQGLDPEWVQNFKGKHAEVAPPAAIDATTVDSVVSSFRIGPSTTQVLTWTLAFPIGPPFLTS